MKELIEEITKKLTTIKTTAGINNEASLYDLNKKIEDLKSAAISNQQQIVLLYTYAKDDDAAENKSKPTFEWTDNGAKISDLPDNGWIPSRPDITDSSESLYIRFVSVAKDKNTDYGIPIKLTGEKGDKGEKGSDGINAVALGASTIVKLYAKNKPDDETTFKFDTDQYRQDGKILENIKVNDISIDDLSDSNWTSSIPKNTIAYEVTIKVTVDNEDIDVLAGPICIVPEIDFVKNQYKLSTSNTECDEDVTWSDEYQYVKVDTPYLWSRIYTKYVNGCKFYSEPFLLNEMQKFIIGIDVTYGASNSVSTVPTEWSKEVPKGIVIWKKEITTFSDKTENTVICPMSIQGEPGIQYIGKFESKDELRDKTISYNNDFIGKIGVIINGETYVWYGKSSENALSDGEWIGNSWWLKLGNITSSITDIKYKDLKNLCDTNQLVPGKLYKIIDYNFQPADVSIFRELQPNFDIIVTAISKNNISSDAKICWKDGYDDPYYSINKYKVSYMLDVDTKFYDVNSSGTIYKMIDDHDNEFGFDFINIVINNGSGEYYPAIHHDGKKGFHMCENCKISTPECLILISILITNEQLMDSEKYDGLKVRNMKLEYGCKGEFKSHSNGTYFWTTNGLLWIQQQQKTPIFVCYNKIYYLNEQNKE